MKKSLLTIILTLAINLCSCNFVVNNNSELKDNSENIENLNSENMENANCEIYFNEYEFIKKVDDVNAYHAGVATNLSVDNGVIISPYYSLTINGKAVPVYATRTTNTVHSFVYVDVEKINSDVDFNLYLTIETLEKSTVLNKKNANVTVLPLKKNVNAVIENKKIKAVVSDFGSYSFSFNKKQDEALTIFIAEKENTQELFKGKTINYIEPGDYSALYKNETLFTEENAVYYFKNGRYRVDIISVPANSILYFDKNAYIEVIPTSVANFIQTKGEENITVAGRGLIDFSACCGSEVPEGYSNNKKGMSFSNVTNIDIGGITVINCQTWTLCLNACNQVKVHDVMFFGYRVFSDGIMLSDCKNAVVERNFIRTGDDAFETKSTTAHGLTENVLFINNDAWTDKGIAYGCIYESNHDTTDVHFEDCRVGFAMGTWSNHLGCCVIQMGNRKNAKMYDITFNNIEIFTSYNAAILNIYIGGSGGRGPGYGIVKDIYFKNVTARRNYGAFLNLRTYDSENCFIYDVYLDNIVSNDILLTSENYTTDNYVTDNVAGGYDFRRLKINTLVD